jgi:hypothetical protein
MESNQARPPYQLQSPELAKWLDEQGSDSWWMVDGDPLLTGRLAFPCPADELSRALRELDRPLLVQARESDSEARGQIIDAGQLDRIVASFADSVRYSGPAPEWLGDRLLYLCWKGSPHEWLLAEDSVTAKQFDGQVAPKAK